MRYRASIFNEDIGKKKRFIGLIYSCFWYYYAPLVLAFLISIINHRATPYAVNNTPLVLFLLRSVFDNIYNIVN